MWIYLKKNNPENFHLDPIWNDRTLGIFWRRSPQQQEEQQQQDEQGYWIPDPKTYKTYIVVLTDIRYGATYVSHISCSDTKWQLLIRLCCRPSSTTIVPQHIVHDIQQ